MKKNNFKSLAAVLSLAMAATAVPVNANAAAAPKITVSKKTVYSGKTYSATVTNLKKGYTVQFSSTEGGVNFKAKKVKATGKKVTAKFTVKAAKSIADGAKTKIKAVVKNAKGKKVKTVSQSVTLKQLATGLTVKDVEKTTVTVGEVVNADATIAPAAAKGAYKKTFTSSDSSVLKVTDASNGTFEAVAPGKATILVSAANDKGKVVEGSKPIEITVVAAEEKPENPTPENPTPVEPSTPDTNTTGSAIKSEYSLDLKLSKDLITANSKDQATLDVTLTPPTETVEGIEKMKVAAQVVLGTPGIGSLSKETVTLVYNAATKKWEGQLTFTSATLNNAVKSTIKATVASVIDIPEGAVKEGQLVGLASQEVAISLVPEEKEATDSSMVAEATKAVVESCDRIIFTFNRAIEPTDFLTKDGKVNTNAFALLVQKNVKETDSMNDIRNSRKGVGNQYGNVLDYTGEVAGVLAVAGNSNQLQFVLKNTKEFDDNSKFMVKFVDIRNNIETSSQILVDRITDTSIPKVMSVEAPDMKTIRVKFDQPVVSYSSDDIAASNKQDLVNIVNALSENNFAIDGVRISENNSTQRSELYIEDGKVKAKRLYGDIEIRVGNGLARDTVDIVLGVANQPLNTYDTSMTLKLNKVDTKPSEVGNLNKQCYFKPGQHVLQIFNVGDYASLSDTDPSKNRIPTQSITFNVEEEKAVPSVKVEEQSREQFVLTFTTQINELAGTHPGDDVTHILSSRIKLQHRGLENTSWYCVDGKDKDVDIFFNEALSRPLKTISGNDVQALHFVRVEDTEDKLPRVKVEVTYDWTQLEGYKEDALSYNSRSFRVIVPADKITNPANGKTNKEYVAAMSTWKDFDGESPVINAINEIEDPDLADNTTTVFDIVFSEPVQAANDVFNTVESLRAHTITPGYNRWEDKVETLGRMGVEIVNTATKNVYSAEVIGYSKLDLEDKTIRVLVRDNLPTGDYVLYARHVSDDVGNTVGTASQPFHHDNEIASVFKVLSVFADKGDKNVHTLTNSDDDKTADYIYVEFSSAYSGDVLQEGNWTLNGQPLPVGSYVEAGINGYNFDNTGHSGITIVLPNGSLTDIKTTNLKLNANVRGISASGSYITLLDKSYSTFNTPAIYTYSVFDGWNKAGDNTITLNGANLNQFKSGISNPAK